MQRNTTSKALESLFIVGETEPRPCERALTRGLLKSGDALTHIAVIDVYRVDLRKALQRRAQLARRFLGHSQIIPQCECAFRVQVGSQQRAFIPNSGDAGLAF